MTAAPVRRIPDGPAPPREAAGTTTVLAADGTTPADRRTSSRRWFETLYQQHAAAVLAYARRRTEDLPSAEDVLAETFLVAWRRRDAVPADALPWLYAVAGRVLGNQRRSRRRQAAVTERIIRERRWDADPADPVEGDHAVLRALAALRPMDREALLLTAWEGLDPGRAAVAAGCSRAAFHVRLHRARRRLTQELQARSDAVSSSAALIPERKDVR